MKLNALMWPVLDAVTFSSEMKHFLVASAIVLFGLSAGCTNKSINNARIAASAKAYETGDYDKAKRLLEEEREAAVAKMKQFKHDYVRAMADLKVMAGSDTVGHEDRPAY